MNPAPAPSRRGTRRLLLALETALFALGAILAAWCAFVVLRGSYYSAMPVPPPPPFTRLPGERPSPPRVATQRERGQWVARLEAPSLGLSATVLEGSDDGTLARAAGHIEDTAMPGGSGNVGIAGHRDTVFRPLRRIRVGDELVLTTVDKVLRYRVAKTSIVDPEDVHVLDPTDHAVVTLITCFPFEFIGHAPRRFVVRSELIREEARSGGTDGSGQSGGTDRSDPPGPVARNHNRKEAAVVDAQHQSAVRRHPDRLRVRPDRERRAVANPPNQAAGRQ